MSIPLTHEPMTRYPVKRLAAHGLCSALAVLVVLVAPAAMTRPQSTQRRQALRPLPGRLDSTLV
ncbi:MAG: hypothetical protein OXC47_00290, partial [Cyanobacteria bacterium MAG APA_bin_95]|nr:hypothetical protein [Cyanobacteria bacterium MAG APA_bin_95]